MTGGMGEKREVSKERRNVAERHSLQRGGVPLTPSRKRKREAWAGEKNCV